VSGPRSEPTGPAWLGARLRTLAPQRADLAAMGRTPRQDLVAGLTVGVVALPLALAFGISSGIGAAAGLMTAIVAGAVAALFGGSNLQVSGPTGAMTVVLVPIIAEFGGNGVLLVGLIAGGLLVLAALAGVGRYVRLIPLPVIEGFTLGIAVIIALQQVPAALGVDARGEQVVLIALRSVQDWVADPAWGPPVLAALVAVTMLAGARLHSPIPMSLVGLVLASVLTAALDLPVQVIGTLPSTIPTPALPELDLQVLRTLLVPGFAVAALAALESLLSATVADGMAAWSQRHHPDRELFGQGLANLASPLFGGIPATAAIARTAVNVRSGARSRLAALTHAGVILVVVLALGPVVARIPLAALAGVLLATAFRMVEVSSVRALLRTTRSDALVFGATAAATVALDLVTAVVLGIVIAGALALRAVARNVDLTELDLDAEAPDAGDEALSEAADRHILAYRIEGSLFFGGAHQALLELADLEDVRVVILRLSRLVTLDATGAAVLRDAMDGLRARGAIVLLSGVKARHWKVLSALGIEDSLADREHVFPTTVAAVQAARQLVAQPPGPGSPPRR
jgi:SulP family sulfate permease